MIKISNGTKKGFKLKVPSTGHVRPKTSKVRKMIFDIIQDVNNYQILDLFAGCGSLGIESLSMGAKFVTFVDKSNKCSFENKSEVINKSFSEITRQLIKRNNKYNLIFIDPPYDYFDEKSLKYKDIKIFSSPTRLILNITDLPEKIKILSKEIKGPKVDSPDNILESFIKAKNITKEDLFEKNTDKGNFYFN